jgi:hypothetical protein
MSTHAITGFDPSKLSQLDLLTRQGDLHLCADCRHREVCYVPRDLPKAWHIAVASCAHFSSGAQPARDNTEEVIR